MSILFLPVLHKKESFFIQNKQFILTDPYPASCVRKLPHRKARSLNHPVLLQEAFHPMLSPRHKLPLYASVCDHDHISRNDIIFCIFSGKSRSFHFHKKLIDNLRHKNTAVYMFCVIPASKQCSAVSCISSGNPSSGIYRFKPIPTTANSMFPLSKSVTASVSIPHTFLS